MTDERLRRLIGRCLESNLARRGAYLAPHLKDDLFDFLTVTAVEVAARYDHARTRPGYKFESYLWDILERRIIDWWRRELGDSRHSARTIEAKATFRLPLSFDLLAPLHLEPHVEDEPFDGMAHAVEELGAELSEEARWTLSKLARPLAEGVTIGEVAREAGVTTPRACRLLDALREELSPASKRAEALL